MMLLKIAWRNLWRNKRRSFVALGSIIVGIIALMLNDGIGNGFQTQMLNNQIDSHIGHIQVSKAGFKDNKTVQSFIPDKDKVINLIQKKMNHASHSQRVIISGLVSSPSTSSAIMLTGIDNSEEKKVSTIHQSILSGKFISDNPLDILLSKKLAEKLEVEIGDKVIGIASDLKGEVSNQLFRVCGIFSTGDAAFDNTTAFVNIAVLQEMLGYGNRISEIVIKLPNTDSVNIYRRFLSNNLGSDYDVKTYAELLPLIMSYIETYKSSILIIYAIIGLAVIFGIINTMLMSIFERIQEFGVLMSIGMKRSKIFFMVVNEALLLGIFGSVIGMCTGYLICLPLIINGIDLGVFSESLSSFGMKSIVYLELNLRMMLNIFITMPITAVLGAIYPAIKAVKLNPTDAVRYV